MIDKNPKLSEAIEALNRADFSAAIAMLGEVVVEDAENSEAWLHLGVCYLETRQPDLALEALARAVLADYPRRTGLAPRVLAVDPAAGAGIVRPSIR